MQQLHTYLKLGILLILLIGCKTKQTVVATPKRKIIKPQKQVVNKTVEAKEISVPTKIIEKKQEIKQQPKKLQKVESTVPKVTKVIQEVNEVFIPRSTKEYIERFVPIAVREMELYKIPASITLAQGILESGSGKGDLAIRSNNHFGIKCHKGWQGKSVRHDDDELAECFRRYNHPEESYEDHSKFLTSRKRYAKLFKLKPTDYIGWAYGLKRAGYATDPKYPNKLLALIKRYNLHQYDVTVSSSVVQYKEQTYDSLYKVKKGDTLYSISKKFNISLEKLRSLNNLSGNLIKIDQELLVE